MGDALIWLAFTLGGMAFHQVAGSPVMEALRIGGPFFGGYFLAAGLLGAFSPSLRGWALAGSSLKAWGVGTGLGILLRMVVEGRTPVGTFVLVTFAFSGILLLGWRAIFVVWPGRK